MIDFSDVTSLLAVGVSVTAFVITYSNNRKLASRNTVLQGAVFHMDRNALFEGRLSDWPEAFQLHGIDLEKAEKEGVTKEQITYLILSINSLSSVCEIEEHSVYDQLQHNNYRRRMFEHKITRKAWRYARRLSTSNYKHVDRFLSETYGEE